MQRHRKQLGVRREREREQASIVISPPFIALIVEIVFERQCGCYLFPLLLAFVLFLLHLLLLKLLLLELVRQAALIRLLVHNRSRFPLKYE